MSTDHGTDSVTRQIIPVHTVRVHRLATLLDLMREEALAISSRARLEDEITSEGLENALGLIGRIERFGDRLISTLTERRPNEYRATSHIRE